jgi:hypothetical protein
MHSHCHREKRAVAAWPMRPWLRARHRWTLRACGHACMGGVFVCARAFVSCHEHVRVFALALVLACALPAWSAALRPCACVLVRLHSCASIYWCAQALHAPRRFLRACEPLRLTTRAACVCSHAEETVAREIIMCLTAQLTFGGRAGWHCVRVWVAVRWLGRADGVARLASGTVGG